MVYHILKDGSVKEDITGHVVKYEDAETLYRYIHNLNQKSNKGGFNHEQTKRTEQSRCSC